MLDALIAALERPAPTEAEREALALPAGGLVLRRSWPRGGGRLLLEYVAPDRSVVAGQWLADAELVGGIARETAAAPGARAALVAADGERVLLQPGGADRRLTGLASLVARPNATLLAHRAERRAVVRLADGDLTRYVKVVRPERADRVAAAARAAAALAPAAFETAVVVDLDGRSGAVHCGEVRGVPWCELLGGRPDRDAAAAAGRSLAALHGADPGALPGHGPAEEALVLDGWLERLRPFAPQLAERIEALAALVRRELFAGGTGRVGPLHRDLHDKQILIRKRGRIGVIDFDNLASGEAALDLGNLLAHLDLRALQGLHTRGDAEQLKGALLEAYGPSTELRRRLRPYSDATRLRLACLYSFRPRTGALVEALLTKVAGR